jgi:hypothetical protein
MPTTLQWKGNLVNETRNMKKGLMLATRVAPSKQNKIKSRNKKKYRFSAIHPWQNSPTLVAKPLVRIHRFLRGPHSRDGIPDPWPIATT